MNKSKNKIESAFIKLGKTSTGMAESFDKLALSLMIFKKDNSHFASNTIVISVLILAGVEIAWYFLNYM